MYIQLNLAAPLIHWSAANARKSPNMISATGMSFANAMPLATPTMAASLMGVFRTRPGKRALSPIVHLKAPP